MMTNEEAIIEIAWLGSMPWPGKVVPACNLAIAALQAQAEHDNPKPLTLDELRERIRKPVWISYKGRLKNRTDGWIIWQLPLQGTIFDLFDPEVQYGKTFLAYDYKPKEATQ